MNKTNRAKLIISSILIILPLLAVVLVEHFESPKIPMFGGAGLIIIPVMLGMHFLCFWLDKKINARHQDYEQSEVIKNIMYWIIPGISLFVSAMMIALFYGFEISIPAIVAPLMGIMFIFIGNYMPKSRRNFTFGIKTMWTLSTDANWNATHRLSGKLWFVCGIICMACAFLPAKLFIPAFIVILLTIIVVPLVYSYNFYKKQLASGEVEKAEPVFTKMDKKIAGISKIFIVIVVALVALLMFTGKLNFTFEAEKLVIKPTFGMKTEIVFDEIESIEYRDAKVDGMRVSGFASSKLLYGWFKNDEFGSYNRYTYTSSESTIIIVVDGEEYVISDIDRESTKALYDRISAEYLK